MFIYRTFFKKKLASSSDDGLGHFGLFVVVAASELSNRNYKPGRQGYAEAPQEQREPQPPFAKGAGQQGYTPSENAQPIEDYPMGGCWLSERLRV